MDVNLLGIAHLAAPMAKRELSEDEYYARETWDFQAPAWVSWLLAMLARAPEALKVAPLRRLAH